MITLCFWGLNSLYILEKRIPILGQRTSLHNPDLLVSPGSGGGRERSGPPPLLLPLLSRRPAARSLLGNQWGAKPQAALRKATLDWLWDIANILSVRSLTSHHKSSPSSSLAQLQTTNELWTLVTRRPTPRANLSQLTSPETLERLRCFLAVSQVLLAHTEESLEWVPCASLKMLDQTTPQTPSWTASGWEPKLPQFRPGQDLAPQAHHSDSLANSWSSPGVYV
jgi:hypothetical protein